MFATYLPLENQVVNNAFFKSVWETCAAVLYETLK